MSCNEVVDRFGNADVFGARAVIGPHGRCFLHALRCLVPSVRAEAMKKRPKAGKRPATARPSKALKPRGAAPARDAEIVRLTRELSEAVERQAATADLLKVMGRSAIDLQGVLDTLVRSAVRLTQAEMGSLVQPEGSVFRQLASCGLPQELDEFMQTHPVHLGRGTITGRTLIEGEPVQVADILADPEFL